LLTRISASLQSGLRLMAIGWRLPEHIADVPFNGEGAGSASSVDALLHYLWLKRLVGSP